MSAPVTAANSARSGGPLQRMPFGRFKGLPFAQVPEEYAAWLLKRDIDDSCVRRLRARMAADRRLLLPTAPPSPLKLATSTAW